MTKGKNRGLMLDQNEADPSRADAKPLSDLSVILDLNLLGLRWLGPSSFPSWNRRYSLGFLLLRVCIALLHRHLMALEPQQLRVSHTTQSSPLQHYAMTLESLWLCYTLPGLSSFLKLQRSNLWYPQSWTCFVSNDHMHSTFRSGCYFRMDPDLPGPQP